MFIYSIWNKFCSELNEAGINSITADEALSTKAGRFLILKHDVETNPAKALKLAEIENRYGHKGVYYVQAYLLKNNKNIQILRNIQSLGHEVSYHHDVMDSSGGDIAKADKTFEQNKKCFEENGFVIHTVCQHGNPVIERQGYTSNRDFFRNKTIEMKYKDISEIMVNYKSRIGVDYKYISDAGYGWKVIYDPETNDIVNSDDKNIPLGDIDNMVDYIKNNDAVIVSTHPHRWHSNGFTALSKDIAFKSVKGTAKLLLKIPVFEKIMGRFYFLAKKI